MENNPTELIIQHTELSEEALIGLVDEFVTRDSSVLDGSLYSKRARVLQELHDEKVVITYNTETHSSDIKPIEDVRKYLRLEVPE